MSALTASTQASLEAKIESRGDDPDHDIRPVDTETLKQHTAQAQDARQRWNDLGNAHHRQRVDRGDRPATSRFHLRAGHTIELGIWKSLTQSANQDTAEQIAGRSEEHTPELQSLMRITYAVLCLKKKKNN